MNLVPRLLLCSWVLALAIPVAAEPVPESERSPVDLRRTTLLVRDIEASLPLYRDALAMTVIYDQRIGGGEDAEGKPRPATIRLVLLRANDTFIGNLGLMERLDTEPPPRPANARAMAGQPILVFNARDLDTRFEQVAAVPGVEVHTRPTRIDYPGADGGIIPVMFAAIYDPDGFFIEVNHLLGAPAGASDTADDENAEN